MKYQTVIVRGSYWWECERELNSKVNKLIEEGWEPQGGVSIAVENLAPTLCQAMVKHEEIKEDRNHCEVRIIR